MLRQDPLIRFLVLGAILFAGLSFFEKESPAERVVISAEQIAELSRAASLLQGREPDREELERLVDAAIRDEVYYRQALADGLDVGDTVVRQRLIDKMRELTENMVEPIPPETDLRAWFQQNADRFTIPELVTFDQVYLDPAEQGDGIDAAVAATLEALRSGVDPETLGDRTPLSPRYEAASAMRIGTLFGDELTTAVFSEDTGQWIGPFESGFGLHLVRISGRSPSRDPGFDEVADQVRAAYSADALAAANEAAFRQMLSGYEIEVQWPDAATAENSP